MFLDKITDPRDNLEKARRRELVNFANNHNVKEISSTMPAQLIRRILRTKGLVDISIPVRLLGQKPGGNRSLGAATAENTIQVLADDDLLKQWLATQPAPSLEPDKSINKENQNGASIKGKRGISEITRLRQECKAKGIPLKRTDKTVDLRMKLNGEITT